MKIALCTTTIHVPHVLKLMRKCAADVRFFIAGDTKSPDDALNHLADEVGDVHDYFSVADQKKLGWKCSEAIGWNTLARRNIAFLEALKWGADIVYSWDDDNVPVGTDHFDLLWSALGRKFNGIKVTGDQGWFDPGALLIPPTRHRGIPHSLRISKRAHSVIDAKVGVAAGLVIGNPDIDAITRMEVAPDIAQVHILGSTGIVVDPHTHTVFNSQNTAVIRELMPAWFMMPGVGRHDDIYASLIVQRVARERGYHVHFGPPFTYQERNEHDLMVDLRAEIDGMEKVRGLASLLDGIVLPAKSVIDDVRIIYDTLRATEFIGDRQHAAATAWLEDVGEVL